MTAEAQMPQETLPFPDEEYRSRLDRVRAEMVSRGVDTLYITQPSNLYYLTGFSSIWYSIRSPLGVAINSQDPDVVFFDYVRHETLIRKTVRVSDVKIFEYESACRTIAAEFGRLGWLDGVVGVERWSPNPSRPVTEQLEAELRSAGGAVVDGSWIVDDVRLVKSPLEIACVRKAADIVTRAMGEIPEYVRPGASGVELAARMNLLLAEHGGEHAGIPTGVEIGTRGLAHAPASRETLERGDALEIDACGVYNRYHVNCLRSFNLGENPRARSILEITSGSIQHLVENMKVGMPVSEMQRLADEYIAETGLAKYAWWVGGYSLGISYPPDWTGHVYMDGEAFSSPTMVPGFVMNYENVFVSDAEGWNASYIDSLIMTENGLEILTTAPRSLTEILDR